LTNSNISGQRFILVGENCSNKDILCWIADGLGKRHPVFPVGRPVLQAVGRIFEITGKLFHFHPLIDRAIAHIISQREYYVNMKIKDAIGFNFKPIEQCILEICSFRKNADL